MKEIGIYIHIPFCKQKCYYCDFVSFANCENWQEIYVDSIIKEIKNFLKLNPKVNITTIYIGGGTPSYIESKYIKKILDIFPKQEIQEITIELNPGTVDEQKLEDYKMAKINRLSIGLQSAEDRLLKTIGRIHDFEQFLKTYNLAKKVGFNNINVDLIIGLPKQNISIVKDTLDKVVNLDVNHISVYSLIVEEKTKFAQMLEEGKICLLSEEEERNMYWYAKNYLELHKYKHYEISNFAKEGFECKHNLNCWGQKEYIGFGVAAHSYYEGCRFSNTEVLDEYVKNCKAGVFEQNKIIHEKQSVFSKEQEFMLLGLRKIDGVCIQDFKNKFAENPIFVFRKELHNLVNEGLLVVLDDNIRLTRRGIDLANIVWEEFV